MNLTLISDTHGQHNFEVREGDVLIHAGDLTHTGTFAELRRALLWLKSLPHKQTFSRSKELR